MNRLLSTLLLTCTLFFASPFIFTNLSFAAVGEKVNYTNLWRGYDGKHPGMDAGTVHANKPQWLCTPPGFNIKLLCGPTVDSFLAMNTAYKSAFGKSMPVGQGYRTKEGQQDRGSTFATYERNYAPPAHLWGTAIDFDTSVFTGGSKEQTWTVQNGPKYGWYWPNWAKNSGGGTGGHKEPWHFNYYGFGHNPRNDRLENPYTGVTPDGAGSSASGIGGTGSAKSNCVITQVGKPVGLLVLPPESGCQDTTAGFPFPGSSQELAKQILTTSNIQLTSQAERDIKAAADGRSITNSDSCGKTVALHPALLQLMLQLAQKHTYKIGYIISEHGCDSANHPLGRAMDVWQADGKKSWQNASFRQDTANFLPSGGSLLQKFCAGTPRVTSQNDIIQDADECNHQHIDVGRRIK